MTTDSLNGSYDVVVIGGGAAGLAGATALARSRRRVVVIDGGQPRNAPADGVHVLLGHDGIPPAELLARGRAELRSYAGSVVDAHVRTVTRVEAGFEVALTDGRTTTARRLLIATGLVDELPDVPGLAERWGRDVVHCPYCHGWEVRDRAIGVLATGPMSVHQALLFSQLSDDVVLFSHEADPPGPEQAAQLAARGVRIVTGPVGAVEIEGDRISGVRLRGGQTVAREVVAVATRMHARVDFLRDLGLLPQPHPSGMGEHLVVDATGRTEVPGVWAAGNVADIGAQVGAAAAAGVWAGAQINLDLITEDTERAMASMAASRESA